MSFFDLPSLCEDFGPFWMFKLEQTEKDFPFADKLRDVFRSDFERFMIVKLKRWLSQNLVRPLKIMSGPERFILIFIGIWD
jgi:hypothetical protein